MGGVGGGAPAGGAPAAGNAGGGDTGAGFHNIDNLNLGKLLHSKQMGRARKRPRLVKKLMEKGFR